MKNIVPQQEFASWHHQHFRRQCYTASNLDLQSRIPYPLAVQKVANTDQPKEPNMNTIVSSKLMVCLALLIVVAAVVRASSAESNVSGAEAKIVTCTYAIADLAVWRNSGTGAHEFAPEILIAHLRSNIDPASWKNSGDVRPFAKNASLVISQTQANHEKIADLLAAFRDQIPGRREATERVHK